MSYYHSVKKKRIEKKLNPGTLVAHKVFMSSTNDIYRVGIVKFDVDDEHVFVMWCPCEEYPVSKNRGIYSSPVNKGFLEVLNEIP
tara:strand:- start:100 stop:354 length:255 start_codon:yes stop_codon:yes gene_type:complete